MIKLVFALVFLLFSVILPAQNVPPQTKNEKDQACTLEIAFDREIGPGTVDYLDRASVRVKELKCNSLLIRINTPGGNLKSTRLIVERILASPFPVLCYVSPGGGHAGSAGAIILEACHIAGAAPATNIGAASPVNAQGGQISEDMRKKIFNDTRSLVEGLALLRKRNVAFAKDIVDQARAVSSEEAKKINAIDVVAETRSDFLKFCDGKSVIVAATGAAAGAQLTIQTGSVRTFDPDFRLIFLDFVTEPQFAYLMFMASLGLIYFEITHPGTVAPGVIGALGLVLSFVAFDKLEVWWGGVALIILGVVFLILELFINAFGTLGIGGLIAFLIGSLFLFDPRSSGVALPLSLILPTVIVLGAMMLGLAWLAARTMRLKPQMGSHVLIGKLAKVTRVDEIVPNAGQVFLEGETWNFKSNGSVQLNQMVVIENVEGMHLTVSVQKSASPKFENN